MKHLELTILGTKICFSLADRTIRKRKKWKIEKRRRKKVEKKKKQIGEKNGRERNARRRRVTESRPFPCRQPDSWKPGTTRLRLFPLFSLTFSYPHARFLSVSFEFSFGSSLSVRRIPPLSRNPFISRSRFRGGVPSFFFPPCSSFSVYRLAYLCSSSSLFLSTLARVIFASSSLRRCTSSLLQLLWLSSTFFSPRFIYLSIYLFLSLLATFLFHFFAWFEHLFCSNSAQRVSTAKSIDRNVPKRTNESSKRAREEQSEQITDGIGDDRGWEFKERFKRIVARRTKHWHLIRNHWSRRALQTSIVAFMLRWFIILLLNTWIHRIFFFFFLSI